MSFGEPRTRDGRSVREVRWARECGIAMTAACLVANTVKAAFASMLERDVRVRLMKPVVPETPTWRDIMKDARVFTARGSAASAAFIVRSADAASVARAAFGDVHAHGGDLSAIEERILERIFARLLPSLAPICGPDVRRASRPDEFLTYFDLLVSAPWTSRIGVGVAPANVALRATTTIDPGLLSDVPLEATVELGCGRLTAEQLLRLRPGDVVPMTSTMAPAGVLRVGAVHVARGACGVRGARAAFAVA